MVDIPDLSLTLNSCIVNTKEKKKSSKLKLN